MDDARIKVGIGADIKELDAKIAKANAALKTIEESSKKLDTQLKNNTLESVRLSSAVEQLNSEFKAGAVSQSVYDKSLASLTGEQKKIENESKSLRGELSKLNAQSKVLGGGSGGLDQVKKGAANATPTLQEFSRVIQDAPFGIQGVGNNITQLVSQFGYLSKASGGTGAAIKALLGSFIGPAGFLFVVSTVVSLLTVYGDKLTLATSKTRELAKATAEFAADAKVEVANLNQLINIASDLSLSYTTRANALKEINKNYSDYLGNLTLDELGTKKVKKAVDNLTASLIAKAKIQGLESRITELVKDNSEELVDLQLKQAQSYKDINKEIQNLKANSAFYRPLIKDTNTLQENLAAIEKASRKYGSASLTALRSAVGGYRDTTTALKNLNKEVDDSISPLLNLQGALKKQVFGVEVIPEFDQDAIDIKGADFGGVTLKVKPEFDTTGLEQPLKDLGNKITAPLLELPIREIMTQKQIELASALIDLNNNATQIINDGISNTFANLGQTLGESLASGSNVLEALGSTLLSSLGGILVDLGKMAIATGVGLLAVKLALETLGGVGAIAAGIALVAIGSSFAKGAGGLGSSMGGNTASGSTGTSIGGGGGRSGSTNYGSSSSQIGGTYVFEIAGRKLIGVLQNELKYNKSAGASLGLIG